MGRLLWTLHSESKNSISVRPSTKQLAISSSGSNSHADTPFSCIAKNCESDMSVGKVSGGLAWMNAMIRVSIRADGDSNGKAATYPLLGDTLLVADHPCPPRHRPPPSPAPAHRHIRPAFPCDLKRYVLGWCT